MRLSNNLDSAKKIKSITDFVKIEHTLFSLPLIFAGVFLASPKPPSLKLIMLILAAALGARTTALALNRIIDRHIDKRNPRTTDRELPSGRMPLGGAFIILIAGFALYEFSAKLISPFCLALSPIPLAIFLIYPYMKRFTSFAHFGVGFGLSMAPLGGWFAVKNTAEGMLPGLLLSLFMVFWATGFDVIYSTLDEAFDRGENLYSFTSRYGRKRALKISACLHVLSFAVLVGLFTLQIRALAALPLLIVSGYLLYLEHRKAEDVELAFFRINAVIGFAVLAMVLAGVYFP